MFHYESDFLDNHSAAVVSILSFIEINENTIDNGMTINLTTLTLNLKLYMEKKNTKL